MSARRQVLSGRQRFGAVISIMAMLGALLAGVAAPANASVAAVASTGATVKLSATPALSGSSFQRGYIISDYLFYQKDAMSQAQIQTFLNGECPTNNCINVLKSASDTETSNAECPGGYSGLSSEMTAAIIYKVQETCGISAKVILVTLQKEQGLLTRQSPSTGALRAAMGYGCPDTAPCSTSSLGFFRQIYDAAWQFQEYRLNAPNSSRYPVGQTSTIRYSPTASCGSVNVQVTNQATRALYIYTPYTPNAAALAKLGGTGNSCSSYGNRNFWVYWNDYFGSPLMGQGDDKISSAYNSTGAAGGPLGAAVGSSTCALTSTACSQSYANGLIYWSTANGAIVVSGAMYSTWQASGGLNGPLGAPTRNDAAIAATANPAGSGQLFAGGSIYSSSAGIFVVSGAIRTEYWAQQSNAGALGWPTAAQTCAGTLCSQTFQGGVISGSSTAAFSIVGSYATAWAAAGGLAGSLGVPIREQSAIPASANVAGSGQLFADGSLYSSAAGVFAVTGAIRSEYWNEKSNAGPLGWPTSNAVCTVSACTQAFQGGEIAPSTATADVSILGAYATAWTSAGGISGLLGAPLREQAAIPASAHSAGSGQLFAGGSIYSSSAGTFVVSGAVRTEYWNQKSNAGALGWPTANESCAGTSCSQSFQGGVIVPSTSTVDLSVLGAYNSVWSTAGGLSSALGAPQREQAAIPAASHSAGSGQLFAGGSIYSSPAGTFIVSGPIRTLYWNQKSSAGKYGWPIANETCTGGVCAQKFQGGTITS